LSDEWPPQEWFGALVGAESGGVTATVQFVVTGAPGGEARYFLELDGGRVVRAEQGSFPDADVTFTQTYDDAQQMQRGEFDASVAFMQGRMKFAGDMAKLMSPDFPLLAAITSIAARAAA
jgi:putative sterol carrier protein